MLLVYLLPIIGLAVDVILAKLFPKAKFNSYDILPFFFIPACNLISEYQNKPSFLPYGFLLFFIFVVWFTVDTAIRNKNISFGKTLHELWKYLTLCSIFWYVGLLCFSFF